MSDGGSDDKAQHDWTITMSEKNIVLPLRRFKNQTKHF